MHFLFRCEIVLCFIVCVDIQLVVGALVHACIADVIQCWHTKSSAFKVCLPNTG